MNVLFVVSYYYYLKLSLTIWWKLYNKNSPSATANNIFVVFLRLNLVLVYSLECTSTVIIVEETIW